MYNCSMDDQVKIISHRKDGGAEKPLEEHLREVADLAKQFAEKFRSGEWAHVAGLLHDLGKFSSEFQEYIKKPDEEKRRGEVNHSSAGAIQACDSYGMYGRILAYLIAGHHAGLPDYIGDGRASLTQRLRNDKCWLEKALANASAETFLEKPELQKPDFPELNMGENPLAASLWVRMLFSCLVDADFLATEGFMDSGKSKSRADYPSLEELKATFDSHIEKMEKEAAESELNRIRCDVSQQCADKGKSEGCGIYTLTVPTGGGKTLASMRFALEHALANGKERIIYAIPFTSIIEQTANVYRGIWGEGAVVEHHSNIEHRADSDNENISSPQYKQRLASENWDAPIVVTTNVQFFESLFAAKTSRCRKLHNIVNSVVILDEAQMLPPEFLVPILHAIKELRRLYNVTFVLCTATQPAFGSVSSVSSDELNRVGFSADGEICSDIDGLAGKLQRVNIHIPRDMDTRRSWDEMADELGGHRQALCIVNTKKDCRELYEKLCAKTGDDGKNIHLSTNMCGAHRADKIGEVRELLESGESVRVVSTSLIEAGVDVDFPVVYRAAIGLDSIAQAAGRCNREGKMKTRGDVHVFIPPELPPTGLMRKGWQEAQSLLENAVSDSGELLAPDAMRRYFAGYYQSLNDVDKREIMALLGNPKSLSFRTAAEKFQLIEEGGFPVIVPYGGAMEIVQSLDLSENFNRKLLRSLQRFTVNVREKCLNQMLNDVDIEEQKGVYVLRESRYCPNIGLKIRDGVFESDTVV